jgi:hypothetical protein
MTEQEQAVIDRWSEGLPKGMLNVGHKPGRSKIKAVLGRLLLDWFIRPQVKIETLTGGDRVMHMVCIVRFGEVHSFLLNDNAVMFLGISIKNAKPQGLYKGFAIHEPEKIGMCVVPQWAVGDFLEEFLKVYIPTVDRFNDEMALAIKDSEGKPVNVTIH